MISKIVDSFESKKIKVFDCYAIKDGISFCIYVSARPGSSTEKIKIQDDGSLKIWVHAVPQNGEANKAIVYSLAKALGLSKSLLEIVSGEGAKQKKIRINYQFTNNKTKDFFLEKLRMLN